MRRLIPPAALLLCLAADAALSQSRRPPRLDAVAETKLLMEGLAQPNLKSVARRLLDKPQDVSDWQFARGQALLIAETGNLLMLRPPRNQGQDLWLERSADLREAATLLGRSLGIRDYERSKGSLVGVVSACNRCHDSFRVPVKVDPFGE